MKARLRPAIHLRFRGRVRGTRQVGYQYRPPKKRWRDKWREILRILRE